LRLAGFAAGLLEEDVVIGVGVERRIEVSRSQRRLSPKRRRFMGAETIKGCA